MVQAMVLLKNRRFHEKSATKSSIAGTHTDAQQSMGLYLEGLIYIGRIFASGSWGGLFLGGSYYWNFMVFCLFTCTVHTPGPGCSKAG